MYVVLEVGGKQYRLEKGNEFLVNRISTRKSDEIKLKNILFAKKGSSYYVGSPYLKSAYISCEILSHPRGKKVIAFKYKRRKSQKRKVGHRQDLTKLKVKDIVIE